MKKWVIGGVAVVAVFLVANNWQLFYWLLIPPHMGEQFQTWQTRNARFQIRVDAFKEVNGDGAYYVFSSASVGSPEWKPVMKFRYDGLIDIRTNQVHFVNDEIAYAFMGWMLAVTADGGESWQLWSACKEPTVPDICNFEGIKAVDISPDGHGTISLSPKTDPLLTYRTDDFGRTWQ